MRAVLDACVLIPMPLADTLLHLAQDGHFEPVWSATLLEETRRNLVSKLGVEPSRAARRTELMQKAFPWAAAEPPTALIDAMTVHEKDKHVAAAVVTADATLIVTQNLKDFPADALAPYGIAAVDPDDFALELLDADPDGVFQAVDRQRRRLKAPSLTVEEFLRALARNVPQFAAELSALAAVGGQAPPKQVTEPAMPMPIVSKTPEELSEAFFPGGAPDALTPQGVIALRFTAVVQFNHPESLETLRKLSYDPDHWRDYSGLPSMIQGYALTQARHPDVRLPDYICYFKLLETEAGGQVFADHVITDPVLWVMLARHDVFDPWRVLAIGSQPWVDLAGDQGGPAPVGDLPRR